MNSPMHWNPIREIESLHNRFLGAVAPLTYRESSESEIPSWTPPVDILEHVKGYVITVELPGVRKEDVQLTIENDRLTLEGERKEKHEVSASKPLWMERAQGRFFRVLQLSEDADTGQVSASMSDGLMQIHIAKHEDAQSRRIEVNVG